MKATILVFLFIAIFSATVSGRCQNGKFAYNRCGDRCTCNNGRLTKCTRVRRDFLSMPLGERWRFVRALVTISTGRYKADYERLVNIHTTNFNRGIHNKNQFLPWHRWYLLQVEEVLRKVDCRVTLPYWDWSLFSGEPWRRKLTDVFTSAPWGLGGDGGRGLCVTDGPFSRYKWKTTSSNRRECLKRDFNGNPPDIVAVAEIQKLEDFDAFELGLRDSLHNNMHCRIGGEGGTMCSRSSANAPEFLLHHGFTDKLWSDWQKKGEKYKNAYFSRMTSTMSGTRAQPRDFIDLENQPGGVRVVYEDPTHSQYHKMHNYLKHLDLDELQGFQRHRFTIAKSLEFKVFMVNKKEQSKVKAQQNSLEPRKVLSSKVHLSEADKALGFRARDVERAFKRKRELELRKKDERKTTAN